MNELQKKAFVEQVRDAGERAAKKFEKGMDTYIFQKLQEAIPTILGFEYNSWRGEWKIDNCNGRRSLISDLINNKVREEAVKWAKKQKWTPLSKKQEESLRKEFRIVYDRELRRTIREQGERLAQEAAQRIVDEEVSKLKP